jgi:hypothetical protein
VNLFVVGGSAEALGALASFFPGRSVVESGRCAWLAHDDGYAGSGALYSGRPIVWRGDIADGRAPLEASFWLDPPIEDLDGRYVGVRLAGDEVTVFADALGAYPVYRRGDAVSNNAYALRPTDARLRPEVLASLLGGGWSLSGDPIWEGVERIQPQLEPVDPDFDPDRAAALLVAAVRALSDWPGRPNVVPVTAGRDSRVILAAALRAGIDFETTTGGEPGHPDVEIGRELARVAGVPWRLIEHDLHGSVESDWRRAAELLWLTSSGTASLSDAAGFPFGPRPGPLPLWHSGQGGEIARSYYGGGADADGLYRRFVGRRPGRAEILGEEGQRLVREQIEEFAAEADAGELGDLFYLHRRMGTWAGPTHGAVEFVRDTTSPLWSRRLLPDLLGAPPGEFHKQVLERLAPQLAAVPYERPRSLPRKVAGELRRRVRPRPDPFDRILPEIRDAVLSQPHHDAWHVLDRPRVEALLGAPAGALDTMSRYYAWRLATVFGPSA